MKKLIAIHGRVLWFIFLASLSADAEYRANYLIRFTTEILWLTSQIVTNELLFHYFPRVGSFSIQEARVFMGVLFVVDSLYMFFFYTSSSNFPERIRNGDLDQLLAKPLDSQFIATLNRINTTVLGSLSLSALYLLFNLAHLDAFSWWRLPGFLYAAGIGLMVFYCSHLIIMSMNLFFSYSESLLQVWYAAYKLSTRPDRIYHRWVRFIMRTIIPIGLISSVPTDFLLQGLNWRLFLATTGVAFTYFAFARWVWMKAISNYSSASS